VTDRDGTATGRAVVVTGQGVSSAFGRGTDRLASASWAGRPGFAPVTRFDVTGRRGTVAAVASGLGGTPDDLRAELAAVIAEAAAEAGLTAAELAGTSLILAVHGDPDAARSSAAGGPGTRHPAGPIPQQRGPVAPSAAGGAAGFAAEVARAAGLAAVLRTYTSACVAASTALATAATLLTRAPADGTAAPDRIVVAAGYLVEADQFAVFDAARVLATDDRVRPFSAGRTGLLLGDGVAAVILESADAADRRGATPLGRLHGWARTGDAHHVCRPHPDGIGLARAIGAAITRAGVTPADIGYVNAHGSGSAQSDRAEACALRRARLTAPVSSTKSVHGQALEASGLLEFVLTVQSLRHGRLPVNAGFLDADPDCPLDVVVRPRDTAARYALTLNSAFGGANTALLVGAA
jgi:3-oxoacyl-[acyl-carrier-protein] synthase II